MRITQYGAALAAFGTVAYASPVPQNPGGRPLVQSNQLRRVLLRSDLLADAQTLEGFAYSTPVRNRVFGSESHNSTTKFLYDTISALSDYYTVEYQYFVELYSEGSATFKANGVNRPATLMTFSPPGKVTAPVVAAANLGCDAADYPADVSGKIVLISRGTCPFGTKSALAGSAGAVGAVIYNNVPGPLSGTLGTAIPPNGTHAPSAGISQEDGQALASALGSGTAISGDLNVISVVENRTTQNVIAQTKGGDQNNVLVVGAHTDSVTAGPGINDNGSGTIGLLNVARQLVKFGLNNAIRFTWFSAEEFGLLGAKFYVNSLSQEERNKIRLYLNFDMIASPNFIYGIYDGDGSAFGQAGPPGSAEAEKLFQEYFTKDALLNWTATDFSGRSDYGPFLEAGIACGGLFTGAEAIKTEAEVALFGGEAGVAYDVNYHKSGDNVSNLNMGAFIQNAKAIAHAVATYGRSFDSLPPKAPAKAKRALPGAVNKHVACGAEDTFEI